MAYALRSAVLRWRSQLMVVVGASIAISVLLLMLEMVDGVSNTFGSTGRADNAVFVQRGSTSELTSGISREQARTIMIDPRIARGADGEPLTSPEVLVMINVPRRGDGQLLNVNMRGVTARALLVRDSVRLVQGRLFSPGLEEIIVGQGILRQTAGLELGSVIPLQRQSWRVVGTFASGGSTLESEIWGDIEVVGAAFRRGYQSVVVRLADAATLPQLTRDYEQERRLQVRISSERQYYERQAEPVVRVLLALTAFISTLMGVGAGLSAINTMDAAAASRTRELGTLRALGFSRQSVMVALLAETTLLAVGGWMIACALAVAASGRLAASVAGLSFSEVAFTFRMTPRAACAALTFAGLMGVLGGLPAGLRAVRMPVSAAMKMD